MRGFGIPNPAPIRLSIDGLGVVVPAAGAPRGGQLVSDGSKDIALGVADGGRRDARIVIAGNENEVAANCVGTERERERTGASSRYRRGLLNRRGASNLCLSCP